LHETPYEKRALIISPEAGNFTAAEFDPGDWKPTYPSVMFANLTDLDAFWATRVILSFTEDDLRSIVETAEYDGPTTVNYIVRTLLDRRRALAAHWLQRTDALEAFAVRNDANGVVLGFKDLMVDQKMVSANSAGYQFQVTGEGFQSAKQSVKRPEIRIDRAVLAAATERGASTVEVRIWPHRRGFKSEPVRVSFDWHPNVETPSVRRISRG
jgi:hypothetical protein